MNFWNESDVESFGLEFVRHYPERAAHWTLPLVGEMVGCICLNAPGGSSSVGFVTLKE
jgi:hypothetical protein